jgi:hypothetical protein
MDLRFEVQREKGISRAKREYASPLAQGQLVSSVRFVVSCVPDVEY